MDRDALLAAALGAAVLSGCTSGDERPPRPTASPTPTPSPVDPDVALLRSWATAERALAARYAPAVRAVPALKPLRANHLARATAVADHLRARGTVAPAVPRQPRAPRETAALLRALADAETRQAARYVAALARVRDPLVAMLGAELAAGARQHATVLRVAYP